MPSYSIEAVDTQGKKIKVDVEATSSQDAIAKLRSRGYKPTSIKEKVNNQQPSSASPSSVPGSQPATPSTAEPVAKKAKPKKSFTLFESVKHKQLALFTQQLSVLINAGLPIVRSLKILANQMRPSLLKNISATVADDVETGSSLSESLARHPKAFDKLYVNMVRAGEAGGILDVILQRLASFMEKAEAIKRKLVGASVYPAVVMTVAVGVVIVVLTFIVPKFEEVFKQVGTTLPGPTQLLIDVSNVVKSIWFLIILLPIILFILLKLYMKTKPGRLMIDRFKLNMPFLGILIRKAVTARFTRTLGTLLQSGVPILEALNIIKGAAGNEVVANAIAQVHDSIREGENIAEPLAQSGIFDDMVINMIDVGEETGELDKMLLKIADTYDSEVDIAVSSLMSILEPILILFLGLTVGLIVLALFMPLVSLLENIGGKTGGKF